MWVNHTAVILSAAKNLTRHTEILRGVYPERSEWAQNDSQGGLINLDRLVGAGLTPPG